MEIKTQAVKDQCDTLLLLGKPIAEIAAELGQTRPWVQQRSSAMTRRRAKQQSEQFDRLRDLAKLSPDTPIASAINVVTKGAN